MIFPDDSKSVLQQGVQDYVAWAEDKTVDISLTEKSVPVVSVGIVGAGNMGSSIAAIFLMSGFSVFLVEQNQLLLEKGVTRIHSILRSALLRGRISEGELTEYQLSLHSVTDYLELSSCELIIEAIFEDIDVKIALFNELNRVCNEHCIIATNTSYLDINVMAEVLSLPQQLIGMHFFNPAHIMKLVEVIPTESTTETILATAISVVRRLNKTPVIVNSCFGFAGNRMYTRYGREIQQMLLEGASIEQLDIAMTDWGMAMGPLAVQDLSGIDVGYKARNSRPLPRHDPGYFRAAALMVENGRLGRKNGKGFYDYNLKGKPVPSPEAERLIHDEALALEIPQKIFSSPEIVERALMALITEGLNLYQEGIVQRISDIDVIWLKGYGFPVDKGGPMYLASQMGEKKLISLLNQLQYQAGENIWPYQDFNILA